MSSLGGGALPPGTLPPGAAPVQSAGSVVVSGGGGDALVLGQLYSAEVTALLDGKTELLLGNRYLLAVTPFNFSVGDRLTLRLTQQTSQLLTFQLALPDGDAAAATSGGAMELPSLLRAVGLADSDSNRATLSLLLDSGIPLSQRSFDEIGQLLAALPGLPLAGFVPLYKELLDRQLRPSQTVLRQLALLSMQRPEVAGLLAGIAPFRPASRARRQPPQAIEDASAEPERDVTAESAASAAELQALARLLYSSPEHGMAQALLSGTSTGEGAPRGGSTEVELSDLANVAPSLAAGAGAAGQAFTTALRVRHALRPGQGTLVLPLGLDGESVDLRLDFRQLAQRYYQRDFHLRMSLRTAAQGPVEVQLHTHGAGLSVSILAAEPETVSAYQDALEELRAELEQGDSGYVLHKLEAEVASLGLTTPVGESGA